MTEPWKWWPEPSRFGNVAQVIAAAASVGTLCFAFYGLSKAVPFFENLNLREMNARLQIDNRALDAEKTKAATELAELRRALEERRGYATRLEAGLICMLAGNDMTDLLADRSNRMSAMFPYVFAEKTSKPPPEVETFKLTVRAVRDHIKEANFRDLEEASKKALLDAWAEVERKFSDRLNQVILPAINANTRPTEAEYTAAQENRKVALDYRDALFDACFAAAAKLGR